MCVEYASSHKHSCCMLNLLSGYRRLASVPVPHPPVMKPPSPNSHPPGMYVKAESRADLALNGV